MEFDFVESIPYGGEDYVYALYDNRRLHCTSHQQSRESGPRHSDDVVLKDNLGESVQGKAFPDRRELASIKTQATLSPFPGTVHLIHTFEAQARIGSSKPKAIGQNHIYFPLLRLQGDVVATVL